MYVLTYGDSATVALKVTQPLPGGGAVHSTCTSLFSTAESACVTAGTVIKDGSLREDFESLFYQLSRGH